MICKIEKCGGVLVLECGDGSMETDLVFASGACSEDDPLMIQQRAILEIIVQAVDEYNKGSK